MFIGRRPLSVSPPAPDFDTYLKLNSFKLADGRSQCRLCHKVTTHIGNMRQASVAFAN